MKIDSDFYRLSFFCGATGTFAHRDFKSQDELEVKYKELKQFRDSEGEELFGLFSMSFISWEMPLE